MLATCCYCSRSNDLLSETKKKSTKWWLSRTTSADRPQARAGPEKWTCVCETSMNCSEMETEGVERRTMRRRRKTEEEDASREEKEGGEEKKRKGYALDQAENDSGSDLANDLRRYVSDC